MVVGALAGWAACGWLVFFAIWVRGIAQYLLGGLNVRTPVVANSASGADNATEMSPGSGWRTFVVRAVPYSLWLFGVIAIYHAGLTSQYVAGGDWGAWPVPTFAKSLFPVGSVWNFGDLGSSNLFGTPLYPLEAVAGFIVRLGGSYGLAEHVLFYWPPLLLCFASSALLAARIGVSRWWAGAAGFVSAVSTPIMAFMAGGWFPILMGAALVVPIVLIFIRPGLASRRIAVGILIGIATWYDPRNGVMITVALVVAGFVMLVASQSRRGTLRHIVHMWPAGAIAVAMQAPWLVLVADGVRSSLPAGYTSPIEASTFSFNNIVDSLTWFNYAWPGLHVGVHEGLPVVLVLVPLLVIVALIRRRLGVLELWMLGFLLCATLLGAGANPPFGRLYLALFSYVPGFSVFRDDSVYLPYAVVVAAPFVIRGLSSGILAIGLGVVRIRRTRVRAKWRLLIGTSVSLAGVLAVASASVGPLVSGVVSGDIVGSRVSGSLAAVNQFLVRTGGATLWVPGRPSLALRGDPAAPNISGPVFDSALGSALGVIYDAQPYSWITNTRDVVAIERHFGISHIVLDTQAQSYVGLSDSVWFRSDAVPDVLKRECAVWHCRRFGPYVVISSAGVQSVAYSVSRSVLSTGALRAPGASLVVPSRLSNLLPTGKCMSFGRFVPADWSSVSNGDNFQRLSLAASGVSGGIRTDGVMALNVRSGQAALTYEGPGCSVRVNQAGVSSLLVSIRLRTVGAAYASVIAQVGQRRVQCNFPGGSKWAWVRCFATVVNGGASGGGASSTLSRVVVLATPYSQPVSDSVGVQVGGLRISVGKRTDSGALPGRQPMGRALDVLPIRSGVIRLRGLFPPGSAIVWFETFEPGWKLVVVGSGRSTVLDHFRVVGWANGFRIPRSGVGRGRLFLVYEPQFSFNVAEAGLWVFILGLLTLLSVLGLRDRKRRHGFT